MSLSTTDLVAAGQIRVERRWLGPAIRACISLGLLYGAYLVSRQAISVWHFRRGSPEEIRKAIRWDPSNAEFWVARAHALQASLEGADVNEVVRLYETATRMSPDRARYWAELGAAYEWAEREEEARRAYERAQQLFPNSPDVNWKLGNFYARAGRIHEALRTLQKTLLGDPAMRRPTFDLTWRAGLESRLILDEMIPADTEILFAYLNYLAETQRLDEAGQVWTRLLERRVPVELQAAFPYLDRLIMHQRIDELGAAWAALAERHPTEIRRRRFDSNRITNGDFEGEILNGGLDWRVMPVDGVVVSVDSFNHFDGARSLKVSFDGARNVDYRQVVQFVPVQANTGYRFVGYMRVQGITTDSGPRFVVHDAYDSSRLLLSTENVVGSSNWSPQQLEFRTGTNTRLLAVVLTRPPSRRFDNLISGTVWIDHVSLTSVD